MLDSLDGVVCQGVFQRAIEMLAQDRLQRAVYQGRLSATRHTRDANKSTQGERHVHMLQVIAAGSLDRNKLPVAFPTLGRNGYLRVSIQIGRGQGIYTQHLLGRSLKDDLTPQTTRFRPHIHHVIGTQHHILIMLHDDHGVSRITQLLQGVNQTDVVPLVQTDTRLIQYIKYIHQLASDLGSQTDTLALATGQGSGTPVHGKIIQSHIQQEAQAGAYLLQYLRSDPKLFRVQLLLDTLQPLV